MIGRTFNDIEDYIKERIWEFDVQKSENNRPVIKVNF
jgi:hypothetical protein